MTQAISLTLQQLETWLDEFMTKQMSELHIPGVTFSLVQNGELLLAKGYGYANLAQKFPIESDHTLFRVGSISKLFVATAIMQLVEKGLIDLHEDVNNYLTEFQIEDNYTQPVTIANLLTHTAGFDDRVVGLFALDANDLQPLGKHLAVKMPGRVFPPGEAISYSNYGFTLLGYIVELISGMPFSHYVKENILQPLEMNHSSFEQPSSFAEDISIGYRYRQKKDLHQALPFQYVAIPPAGSLSATATDMAKFAIAHLQHGRYKSTRILQEDTARQMQQQQFTHDPRLSGWCYGFGESFVNQHRVIFHDGGLPGFSSLLYLFPDRNLGLFISQNGGGGLLEPIIEQFCDRFLPLEDTNRAAQSVSENKQFLKRYEGSYQSNRYPRKTIGKIGVLGSVIRLQEETEGRLSVPQTLKTPNPLYFEETEPLVLKRQERFHNFAVAKEDNYGKVKTIFIGSSVFSRLSWYETGTFHLTLIGLFILVFLLGSFFGIFDLIKVFEISEYYLLPLLASAVCSLNVLFFAGILFLAQELIYKETKKLFFLLCIPILTSVLAVVLFMLAVLAWLNPEWSMIAQISYSIIAIASLGFIPFLNYWNLLGFRY